jgi:uncharacterized protein (TIGR03435 family)
MRKIAAALLAILGTAAGQQFEVASIKPSTPAPGTGRVRVGSRGGPGTDDPALFTCERCTVLGLIRQSFKLDDYQISGPDSIQLSRFNISAKVPEGTTKAQFLIMLRNLLIDRFQLKFHYEKKEIQAYALVVAKNGPKLKDSSGPEDPQERPARLTERKFDAGGFPILPSGRVSMMMMMGDGHASARYADETMMQLAEILANQIGRPVSDATQLTGKYDFTLNWIGERAGPPSAEDDGPNIFRATEEQLGLKLESKKALSEVLVVDSVAKLPTEN